MLMVRDIMTKDVVTVSPETTVRDAMELLASRHISGAPVMSDHKLAGVISASDLMSFVASLPGVPVAHEEDTFSELSDETPSVELEAEAENVASAAYFSDMWEDAGADAVERFATIDSPEWDVLDEHSVSEAMTRALITVPPTASVASTADLMRAKQIHRVLVTDKGALLGIVTRTDVSNAAAENRLSARTYVFNRDRDFRDDEA